MRDNSSIDTDIQRRFAAARLGCPLAAGHLGRCAQNGVAIFTCLVTEMEALSRVPGSRGERNRHAFRCRTFGSFLSIKICADLVRHICWPRILRVADSFNTLHSARVRRSSQARRRPNVGFLSLSRLTDQRIARWHFDFPTSIFLPAP